MKTLEDRPAAELKAEELEVETGKILRQYEAEKLIQEMKSLIERKGLKVDLVPKEGAPPIGEPKLAGGCTSCTVCPCMICW